MSINDSLPSAQVKHPEISLMPLFLISNMSENTLDSDFFLNIQGWATSRYSSIAPQIQATNLSHLIAAIPSQLDSLFPALTLDEAWNPVKIG